MWSMLESIAIRKREHGMQYVFLPIFLFVACVVALAVGLILVAGLFNPDRPNRVTRMPYESGMDPVHDTRRRFDVRFHLLAIAFLLFDVELLFLYPWAVAARPAVEAAATPIGRVQSGQETLIKLKQSETAHAVAIDTETPGNPRMPAGGMAAQSANVVYRASHEGASHEGASHEGASHEGIDRAVSDGLVESRHLVFGGVMTFFVLLTLGYIYDWRKGVFQWR
jgi:NADH-quinone oxidoreductase subunit A